MEEGVSISSQSMQHNEDDMNETENGSVDFNEVIVENERVKIKDEEKVEDPKVGMLFDSIDELMDYYKMYGKEKGFGVSKRTSKKGGDGKVKYMTVACRHTGKQRVRSSNPLRLRPQSKTDCKAKLSVVLCPDGKWMLNSMVLDHNHASNPGKSHFYRCHRVLQPYVRKRLESNDRANIGVSKCFKSSCIEEGGQVNKSCIEKDCTKDINRVGHLQLREGDATSMNNYFLKMQADNADFFYTMDINEEGRLRNVFWADARSKAAFKEFGDVVTFDTTYLVKNYDLPLACFIGVNHHGQSTLLGCALISSQDTETFTWIFKCWLTCMSGSRPSGIITDEDKAIGKAMGIVFPNAQHRWCMWHIMKKLPEKLRGNKQFESTKLCMQDVVCDSLTKEVFEESWGRFIEKYKLESNEWLLELYKERHRWVPAFVKDFFWAGMSTMQRAENVHTFFDGHVNSKTTLKQFVEQYESTLAKKVKSEDSEEVNSFNSCLPLITHYEMEKQFQSAYTTAKFKEFQQELVGKIYCNLSSSKEGEPISEYVVGEDVSSGESHRRVIFNVLFNKVTSEVSCNCCLFEYRGILCRHQIVVFIQRTIYRVPGKYILKRWSKIVRRSHNKIRISYDLSDKPEARRIGKMCNAFNEVADLAADTEDRCEKVIGRVRELKGELNGKEDIVCPNISGHTSISGMSQCFVQPDMLQGGNFPFPTNMIVQGFGMHPVFYHGNESQAHHHPS